MKEVIESINLSKDEYAKLYEESSQDWAMLLDDGTLQDITTRLDDAKSKVMKLKTPLKTLSPMERMAKVAENKTLQVEFNWLHK